MSEPVFGTDVVIEWLVDGEYFPVLCGNDCRYSRRVDFIEASVPTSGVFRDWRPGMETWEMYVTGLTKIANSSEALSWFYMLQTAVRRVKGNIRMTFTDSDGANVQISGEAYIGDADINGPIDWSTGNISFRGTGAFEVSVVLSPVQTDYDVLSDYWNTQAGLNYVRVGAVPSQVGSYLMLLTDVPLEVDVEGVQYEIVTGAIAAGERKCRFDTSLLRLIFPSDLVFDGSQFVFCEFKRVI